MDFKYNNISGDDYEESNDKFINYNFTDKHTKSLRKQYSSVKLLYTITQQNAMVI